MDGKDGKRNLSTLLVPSGYRITATKLASGIFECRSCKNLYVNIAIAAGGRN